MKRIHITSRPTEAHNSIEFHMVRRRKDGGFAYTRRPQALYTYLQNLARLTRQVQRRFDDGAYDYVPMVRTSPDPHEVVVEAAQLVPGV